MKRGICPKCDGHSIYRLLGHHAQREMVTLKSGIISKGAAPDRYVCGSCGYVESYLSAEDDLKTVRETWEPVSAAGHLSGDPDS